MKFNDYRADKSPLELQVAYRAGQLAAITEIETKIASLGLGVRASVCLRDSYETLEFGKLDKKWCLLYVSRRRGLQQTPLVSAPREVRLLAIDLLPDLLERLVETAEREVAVVEQAAKIVAEFVHVLREGTSK